MSFLKAGGGLAAIIASLLVALAPAPAAARVGTEVLPSLGEGSPTSRFVLETSNGYSVGIVGSGRRVGLSVYGHRAFARYAVRGRVSSRRIEAEFGQLGRLSVRFEATETIRLRPPRICKGRVRVVRRGFFVGTIEFEGENGYTQLSRRRVPGSTSTHPPRYCGQPRGAGGDPSDEAFGFPVLAAFSTQPWTYFIAIGGEYGQFAAVIAEARESMRIWRAVFGVGGPRSFDLAGDLSAATVRPPKPFNGEASFRRNADGSTSWSSSLSASFPGVGTVDFTDPGFTASLAEPKSTDEYYEMIGRGRGDS